MQESETYESAIHRVKLVYIISVSVLFCRLKVIISLWVFPYKHVCFTVILIFMDPATEAAEELPHKTQSTVNRQQLVSARYRWRVSLPMPTSTKRQHLSPAGATEEGGRVSERAFSASHFRSLRGSFRLLSELENKIKNNRTKQNLYNQWSISDVHKSIKASGCVFFLSSSVVYVHPPTQLIFNWQARNYQPATRKVTLHGDACCGA